MERFIQNTIRFLALLCVAGFTAVVLAVCIWAIAVIFAGAANLTY